ncbi:hypothetical protein D3C76_1570660 [compost metagenome]
MLEKGKVPKALQMEPVNKIAAQQIYTSFADCVLRGEQLAVSLEEAVKTMRIVDAISESAKLRKELTYGDSLFLAASRI